VGEEFWWYLWQNEIKKYNDNLHDYNTNQFNISQLYWDNPTYWKCNKEDNTIKIGAIFPLTGTGSVDGNYALNGINLAVKEINSMGGINGKKIEIVAQDDNGDDPKDVISSYQTLKLKGINLFIGPMYSNAGQALALLVVMTDQYWLHQLLE